MAKKSLFRRKLFKNLLASQVLMTRYSTWQGRNSKTWGVTSPHDQSSFSENCVSWKSRFSPHMTLFTPHRWTCLVNFFFKWSWTPDTTSRPWVLCFFNYSVKKTEFFPVLKNGIFQPFSRSAVFPTSLYKKMSMVKVVHHSIFDKIKKNQVNGCSRLQNLGAWKWSNFIRRGKLQTNVKIWIITY